MAARDDAGDPRPWRPLGQRPWAKLEAPPPWSCCAHSGPPRPRTRTWKGPGQRQPGPGRERQAGNRPTGGGPPLKSSTSQRFAEPGFARGRGAPASQPATVCGVYIAWVGRYELCIHPASIRDARGGWVQCPVCAQNRDAAAMIRTRETTATGCCSARCPGCPVLAAAGGSVPGDVS